MRINLSQTLSHYYNRCTAFNGAKTLKEQLRTEKNTGHLLLVLLGHNPANRNTLYTNLASIATQSGQSIKTVRRHLQTLQQAGIIREYKKSNTRGERNKFRIVFDETLFRFSEGTNVDNLWINHPPGRDNPLPDNLSQLHSENGQIPEKQQITQKV